MLTNFQVNIKFSLLVGTYFKEYFILDNYGGFFLWNVNITSELQQDLGSISSEIQTLQEQSMSMNIKLKNRQVTQSQNKYIFIGNI